MNYSVVQILTIAIASFIPWLITLSAVDAIQSLPRLIAVLVHYVMVVILFGMAFAIYFKSHPKSDPFLVMTFAIVSILIFDLANFQKISMISERTFDYVDWIVPIFLITTTIYSVGKILHER